MLTRRNFSHLLDIFVFLIFSRFILCSIYEAGLVSPCNLLVLAGTIIGYCRPSAALFAFTAAVLCLTALAATSLVQASSPIELTFQSIWCGSALQKSLYIPRGTLDSKAFTISWAIDLILAIVILSLVMQIVTHWSNGTLSSGTLNRPIFGFGDHCYFLTSALIWIQGLAYFKELRVRAINLIKWVNPIVAIYGLTMLTFFLFQLRFNVPPPHHGYAYSLPCEDISSLGSLGVALVALNFTLVKVSSGSHNTRSIILILVFLTIVIASWSRAAWLTCVFVFVLVSWYRLPRSWSFYLLCSLCCAVLICNAQSRNTRWLENPYLERLISLVRFEKLANKDPTRVNLYYKGINMILNRPIVGHGIGSFYLESVKFARPNDPWAPTPDFAHNTFLLFAAELGLPATILFFAMLTGLLFVGWASSRCDETSNRGIRIGCITAAGAYLWTQMTANSLNVYASNQFFFWWLLATIGTDKGSKSNVLLTNKPAISAFRRYVRFG